MQEPTAALGKLGGAITAAGPFTAPGELDLTQALGGQLENASGRVDVITPPSAATRDPLAIMRRIYASFCRRAKPRC